MGENPLISIYTQVYNTEEVDLRQCIESVLGQSYTNFEYFILDNGSTDGSAKILLEYAEQDARIHLKRLEPNVAAWRGDVVLPQMQGEYYATVDSDDWWEPDYLEKLLAFTLQNDLDIACTGSKFHYEAPRSGGERHLQKPLVLARAQYHLAYPIYHAFFRTVWGKLIRQGIVKKFTGHPSGDVKYGLDTVLTFRWLRESRRMGVDSSVLHHYRVHGSSISYQYDPQRFQSDVYLYNDAMNFLRPYGPVSAQNQTFLYQVYANAVLDTRQGIQKSSLSTEEKLHEYAEIAAHPITQMAYRCQEDACKQSRQALLNLVCAEGLRLQDENENLQRALQALLPRCGLAVTAKNLPLLLSRELKGHFLQDDRDGVVRTLVPLLPRIKNPQQYDLGTTVQRLAIDHRLLFWIDDLDFLKTYTDLYRLLWDSKNEEALEEMTGILLEDQVKQGKETFLKLYIDLAAQMSQESAFVFGKIKMADFYYRHHCIGEARTALKELEELGLGELEAVKALRLNMEQKNQQ